MSETEVRPCNACYFIRSALPLMSAWMPEAEIMICTRHWLIGVPIGIYLLNTDLVVPLVADMLAAPAEVVIAAELHDIRHQIVTLDDDVLDHLGLLVLPLSCRGKTKALTTSTMGSDTSMRGKGM